MAESLHNFKLSCKELRKFCGTLHENGTYFVEFFIISYTKVVSQKYLNIIHRKMPIQTIFIWIFLFCKLCRIIPVQKVVLSKFKNYAENILHKSSKKRIICTIFETENKYSAQTLHTEKFAYSGKYISW